MEHMTSFYMALLTIFEQNVWCQEEGPYWRKSYTGARGRAILEQEEELNWSKRKSYTGARGRAILEQRGRAILEPRGRAILEQEEELYWSKEEELYWSKEEELYWSKRKSYTGARGRPIMEVLLHLLKILGTRAGRENGK